MCLKRIVYEMKVYHTPTVLLLTVGVQDPVAAIIWKGATCWVEYRKLLLYRAVEYHSLSDDSEQ